MPGNQEKDDCCIHVEMKLLYPANIHINKSVLERGLEHIQTRGVVHFYHFCPAIVGKEHIHKALFRLSANRQLVDLVDLLGFLTPVLKIQKTGTGG